MSHLYTIIVKPTKACNADCGYCSAPPEDKDKWTVDDFKKVFDKLSPYLAERAFFIWHGGEPMLMGPEFYRECADYAWKTKPEIRFSMQSNMLLYTKDKWYDVFNDIFKGSVSSSLDPDWKSRTISGNPEAYKKVFYNKLDRVLEDGFKPLFIGTYNDDNLSYAMEGYEHALAYEKEHGYGYDLRFNYCYPAGREAGELFQPMSPKAYGDMLVDVYNRWITDVPDFVIVPQIQMMQKILHIESHRCPWLKDCGGRFMEIEPNGDVFNCADFADTRDMRYSFGNIHTNTMDELLSSAASRQIRRRRFEYPDSCGTCEHFQDCQGGCARDSLIYGRGIDGKFFYCESWYMIFSRIKESIRTGEAEAAMKKLGFTIKEAQARMNSPMANFIPIAS